MAVEFKKSNKTVSLDFMAEGEGGLQEVSQKLKQCADKAVFGLVKVKFYDEMAQKKGSPYIKFIYFRFLGTKVGVMTKGFLTPRLGSVDEIFPVKHLSYDIDENLTKFDQKSIATDFLRVSDNKVEASSFDFGPNQTYHSQNEVIVNNNKKPQTQAPVKNKQPAQPKKVENPPPPAQNDAKEDDIPQVQEDYNDNNNNNDNANNANNDDNYNNNDNADDNNNNNDNMNNDDNNYGGDDNNNDGQNNQEEDQ